MTDSRPVALVTGASSGIGAAAAAALVEAGFDVVGTSRNTASVTAPEGVTFLALDVASDESVAALVDDVIARFGRIDVLVNNAGIGAGGAAEESSIEQAQRVFDVNFFGVVRMTKAVLPHMRAQAEGRIINISSVLGFVPVPFGALYAASKHAIEGYSESVDHEVRQHGVRVLLVEPGFTKTAFDANIVPPGTTLADLCERATTGRGGRDEVLGVRRRADQSSPRRSSGPPRTRKPKLRYPAGRQARQLRTLRRLVPARTFDKQIHKFNRLPA